MRIDSMGQIPVQTDFGEMLKNLEVGDTVKGRVIEASNGNIAVRTPAGQVFTAALLTEVEIQKGAFIELLINNIADGKAFAEIKESEGKAPDADAKLGDVLVKLNIPANPKNLEAARLLVKYNLPVEKDTLTAVVSLQKSLASLGESKSEGLVGLLLSGMDVKNTPVDVLNRIVLASETEVKNLISKQEQNNAGASSGATEPEQPGASKPDTQVSKAITANVAGGTDKEAESIVKTAASKLGENMEIKPEAVGKSQSQDTDSKAVKDITQQFTAAKTGDIGSKSSTIANDLEQQLFRMGVEKNSATAKLITSVANTMASIDKKDLENIVFLMSKDMEVTPKNLAALEGNINNTKKVSEFLDKLQVQVDKYDRQDLKEIKEEIKKLFMKPEQLEDKNAVKEHIRDIIRLGEKLESTLTKGEINDADIRNTLTNLRDNIDFIRSVNEYSNYLQLPVMINDRKTTTDIYVFRENKKGKKIDPRNATILIALDLKYAGHVESLVNVDGKSVNTTFRLQDKSIGSLIKSKAGELEASLEARGYSLNPIKVIELEQSFNLLSLEKMMSEGQVDKLHFDMKI